MLKPLKILLVDDDVLRLKAHQRLIRCMECSDKLDIHQSTGVAEGFAQIAFAAATGTPYDLVISDVDMKDGTGFDLVSMIRDKYATAPTELMNSIQRNYENWAPQLVLVSGHVDDAKRAHANSVHVQLFEKTYFSTDVLPIIKSQLKMRHM